MWKVMERISREVEASKRCLMAQQFQAFRTDECLHFPGTCSLILLLCLGILQMSRNTPNVVLCTLTNTKMLQVTAGGGSCLTVEASWVGSLVTPG